MIVPDPVRRLLCATAVKGCDPKFEIEFRRIQTPQYYPVDCCTCNLQRSVGVGVHYRYSYRYSTYSEVGGPFSIFDPPNRIAVNVANFPKNGSETAGSKDYVVSDFSFRQSERKNESSSIRLRCRLMMRMLQEHQMRLNYRKCSP